MALSNIIDTSRMKAPAFCMVLTGVGDFAYKRTDGVYVVPIGCLKINYEPNLKRSNYANI